MYDSTAAADIPRDAAIVAGYLPPSRYAWSAADWARFPSAVKVRIVIFATVNDGHVLDVEQGDARPDEVPGWVQMRRRAGLATPTVYCSLSIWQACRDACARAGVPEPLWWIARYDNNPVIPVGAVAKQYANEPLAGGHFDLSVVADHWPGVDQEADMAGELADKVMQWMFDRIATLPPGHPFKGKHPGDMMLDATGFAKLASDTGTRSEKKIDGLGLTISDGDAKLLAAVQDVNNPGPTDVAALVAALAPPLIAGIKDGLPPDASPEQIADAVRTVFVTHLGGNPA